VVAAAKRLALRAIVVTNKLDRQAFTQNPGAPGI
jgi:hypothetical protein